MDNKLPPSGKSIVASTGKTQLVTGKPITSDNPNVQRPGSGNKVDIDFVFDTTGSMEDKIKALLTTCRQFVDEAKRLGLDPYFSLTSFGDISVEGGGDRIELVVSLTGNIERIKAGLTNIPRNNGFGNEGESCLEALEQALKIQHRPGAVKVIILITDEPALQYRHTAEQMTKELKKREYLVFVIATPHEYYKHMAWENGGIWKEISASTSLNDILDIFRKMAKKVVEVAKDVHKLGGGSVSKYLQLKPPEKSQ